MNLSQSDQLWVLLGLAGLAFAAWKMGWLTPKKPAAKAAGLPPAPEPVPTLGPPAAILEAVAAPQTVDAMKAQVADLLERIEWEDARKAKVEAVAAGGISALKEHKKAVLMP